MSVHSSLSHPVREEACKENAPSEIPLFSEKELLDAAKTLQNKKAPGPDGISAEILKAIANICPHLLLDIHNSYLKEGIFHEQWKIQRLVLISKGKGQKFSVSLQTALYAEHSREASGENTESSPPDSHTEAAGDLADRQYRFRKGSSTVHAIQKIVETAKKTQEGNHILLPR